MRNDLDFKINRLLFNNGYKGCNQLIEEGFSPTYIAKISAKYPEHIRFTEHLRITHHIDVNYIAFFAAAAGNIEYAETLRTKHGADLRKIREGAMRGPQNDYHEKIQILYMLIVIPQNRIDVIMQLKRDRFSSKSPNTGSPCITDLTRTKVSNALALKEKFGMTDAAACNFVHEVNCRTFDLIVHLFINGHKHKLPPFLWIISLEFLFGENRFIPSAQESTNADPWEQTLMGQLSNFFRNNMRAPVRRQRECESSLSA